MLIDRMKVLGLWKAAFIEPKDMMQVLGLADTAMAHESDYVVAGAKAGVPWYVIAALHMREASFNFKTYLGNGQSLFRRTTIEPKGRGPFGSWAEGAADALMSRGFSRLPQGAHWDIVTSLIKIESFNGLAYEHMGLPSPYVWSLTNIQKPGKYVRDHVFDPHFMDPQCGCAALLIALRDKHAVDLQEG